MVLSARIAAALTRSSRSPGKGVRDGLYYCNDCEGQFTATVGTVFERSKIPLSKWGSRLSSGVRIKEKACPAHQLHRMLGVTYKTAWFMSHRIREAMVTNPDGPLGSNGGTVEADENFLGYVHHALPRLNASTSQAVQ